MVRLYREGARFTTWTDYDSLKWIWNFLDATSRLARWHNRLTKLEFNLGHREGVKNQAADPSSRLQTTDADTVRIEDKILVAVIDKDTISFFMVRLENLKTANRSQSKLVITKIVLKVAQNLPL